MGKTNTEHKRIKIDIKLYGIGVPLQFLYDHWFTSQIVFFIFSCFCYQWGWTFPLFLFVIIEGIMIWFQHKAPRIDAERRKAFNAWINDSIVQSGGESCNFVNSLLDMCFEKMLPDTFSNILCPIASRVFQQTVPFFINYLQFTAFSFGYTPPKILQVVSDQTQASKTPANSISLNGSFLFANEIRFACNFKILRLIPCTLVVKDIVLYAPVQLIIESPEENKFLNTSIITAIAFTATQPLVLLHANIYFNGFCVSKIPLANHLISLFVEHQANLLVSKGECVVWDWITNTFSFRHLSRSCTKVSQELFQDIATKDNRFDAHTRFSLSNDTIQRYDETRKMYWERTNKAKLAPNEKLIQMAPPAGAETEPVFFYREEKKECVNISIQTQNNV
ncbi:hypothetical protein TRFO_01609 [Tritrichomonas foetus]|uniref:Uncharacterized protein n=1 Tax=Tritrichomonas foetus TaxID=1144522 RepID=A0A1J4JU55_9EUKA|nr:hypothetical protein TRFO_01609 [Tritrichomonas foetus]|eukprot:OHT01054.1 hypothetical protein TRFO_01609 [Tritrichomonas foetus]